MATTKIEASNIATGAVPSTGFTSVQVFTAAATWTKPTDITKVIVEVQGGGGGGGQSGTATYIIGGSGGGYAKKFIDVNSNWVGSPMYFHMKNLNGELNMDI